MIPIAFDGCFGWFHPGGTLRGVVLCGPVGEEADCVYPNWREFAERLAKGGFSALRFDYPGLYNSLDLDEGRDPPTAWVESIKAAIGWLKAEAGVEDVTLVGLRFGAGLALKCAEELGGMAKLVLMAPVVSGVAYQRELALLAKLSEGRMAVGGRETPHQPATLFTAEKTFSVESLRLGQGGQKPAERILIVSEAVSASGKALGQRLRTLGSEVNDQPFQGFAELMVQPEWAHYPEHAFGKVLDWLRRDAASAGDGSKPIANRPPQVNAELFPSGAHEVAIHFREERALFGIQCVPDTPREGRPGIVFLNTNAVPLGGMNRIWVSMARRFAALGFTSLRFDVHGVGDSSSTPTKFPAVPRIEHASVDVAAAISRLQGQGCSTITLVGFCWGAQLAYNAALADDRVTNLIMINAGRNFWDPGAGDESLQPFSTHLRLLRDPTKWKSFKKGEITLRDTTEFVQHLIRAGAKATYDRVAGADTARRKTIQNLRSFKGRGTRMLLVHGSDDTYLAEFEDYFGVPRHGFGSLLNIHTHFFPGVSHRFPAEKSLSDLIQVVGDHLSAFTSAVAPAVAPSRSVLPA